MWSRKFDPMIDQTVVNSVDKLLGISHKGSMPIFSVVVVVHKGSRLKYLVCPSLLCQHTFTRL